MADSTCPPICSTFSCNSSSSTENCRNSGLLSEPTGDIVLGLLPGRRLEDNLGRVVFDEFSQQEETGAIGDACSLLHVMGNNDDSALVLQGKQQIFDLGGGNGVE